jgi:hypothetical protein
MSYRWKIKQQDFADVDHHHRNGFFHFLTCKNLLSTLKMLNTQTKQSGLFCEKYCVITYYSL